MEKLIEVKNLYKTYEKAGRKEPHYVLRDISLDIYRGESIGLVGESGCGKTTLGKCLLQLEPISKGKLWFHGENITGLPYRRMIPIRRKMQMVFQNSYDSFDPYYDVRQVLMESVENCHVDTGGDPDALMTEILEQVGLGGDYLMRYPTELSGGQCQRVGIARALVTKPEFVVCDEAVSSLDYAIRDRILDLLRSLKEEYSLTYLFISHDMSAVRRVCDRVIVMYLGEIVEMTESFDKERVKHPYTKALLAATLGTDPRKRSEATVLIKKEEDFAAPEQGCVLQNRCPHATERCFREKPELKDCGENHLAACHLV